MDNDSPGPPYPYDWVPGLLWGKALVRERRIVIRDPLEPLPDGVKDSGGLVSVVSNAVVIWSRVDAGPVHIRVNYGFEPLRAPTSTWEGREEVAFVSSTGVMEIDDLIPIGEPGDHGYPLNLAFRGPGRYGLLVHGRSRRLSARVAPKEVGESYMLYVWPQETT
ncbi:hypothetical protein ABT294_17295 [Nonomuraea sp. NPDC000554]|uniref:hypothetical protein n=1 Tax=Nonomuraea sp. NPDC000554 TaxID=3154259 RepID=UPI003327DEA3